MKRKDNRFRWYGTLLVFALLVGPMPLMTGPGLPVPAAAAEMEGEEGFVLPEYYPDRFDGTGRINRIAMDEVVIDDSLYRFSPYAEYATPTDRHALRAWFQVGNRVGYVTNERHEIISLWLLE
jgi:hypothetical protein